MQRFDPVKRTITGQRLHSFFCMKRSYHYVFLIGGIVWLLAGCGKKGDPSVPIVPEPLSASNVSASVTEKGIVLAWNPPVEYDTEDTLELDGIKYFRIFRSVEPPLDTGWAFAQSSEGWTTTGQSLGTRSYKGVLRSASEQKLLTVLSQGDLKLNAEQNRFIRLRLWSQHADQGYLAFITNTDKRWDKNIGITFEPAVHTSYYAVHKTFNSSKLKQFPLRRSTSPVAHEYVLDMQSVPAWKGEILQLGLILQNTSPEEAPIELGLDSIEFIQDIDALSPTYNTAPWVFLDNEEGWRVLPSESLFGAAQGVLYAEGGGQLSLLSDPGQRIHFHEDLKLQLRIKVTAGDEAYLLLRQGGEKPFRSEKELADALTRGIRIPLKNSSEFSTYTLDLHQYAEALGFGGTVAPEASSEPEGAPQKEQSAEETGGEIAEEEGSPKIEKTKRKPYFAQIGLVFPAVATDVGKRRISIDYIDILTDDMDSAQRSSRLAQQNIASEQEIAREVSSRIQEKRAAFSLAYESLPEEEEPVSGEKKILLAEISPSEPFPANIQENESQEKRFVLTDSGQIVVENEDGQEMTATLEYGNRYSYEIEVVDRKKRKSKLSEAISVEFMRVPAPPENVRAEAGDEQVTLSWNRPVLTEDGKKIQHLASYQIFRAASPGKYAETPLSQVPASQTQFVDRNVKNRETYYYVVQAVASKTSIGSSGKHSSEVSAMPLDANAPEAPEGLVGVYLDDKVNLHWNQVPAADFAGFNIYRSDSRDGEFTKLNDDVLPKASFTDAAVEAKKRYYYYVTALDDEIPPNESDPSELEPIETYPLD